MLVILRKTSVILSFLLIAGTHVFAQAPQQMSYQAVIRNSSNVLVASQSVGMRISILQGSAAGAVVYQETQTPTTNANGLVSLSIGTGIVTAGAFATIDWAAGPYFIKTETDPAGGTSYSITGTSQLLSVPYALYAATSGSGAAPAPNFVQSYTAMSDATNSSMVSIGGLDFRANTDGHLEVKSQSFFHAQVYSSYTEYGVEPAYNAPSIFRGDAGYFSGWSPLVTSYNSSTGGYDNVMMQVYSTHDCEVSSLTLPAGAHISFKVHALIDGYNNVLLRVEYFH